MIRFHHSWRVGEAAILICVVSLIAACNETNKPSADLSKTRSSGLQASTAPTSTAQTSEHYLGQDWATQAQPGAARSAPSTGSRSTAGSSSASNVDVASPSSATWTLVLNTFSDVGHEEAAQHMLANLPQVAPQVTGARVHTSSKGSMVIYGNYTGRDDPNAVADQERLKSITHRGYPVFNRIILTRLDLRLAHGQLHPHDLLSARRANPRVNPLYTLDIAIWLSNPDPKARDRITFDDVRRRAEAYAAQLRTRGEEAYFYHDEVNQWSTVTIGLFDRRALHAGSGLYSSEVDALLRKHPARLVNGEPLLEKVNRMDPNAPSRPQKPKLVEVPTM